MDFDTELLGIKYELVDFLTDNDLNIFEHYTDVDVCMSEHEIKVTILADWSSEIEAVFKKWAKENGFSSMFCKNSGKVVLKRKAD